MKKLVVCSYLILIFLVLGLSLYKVQKESNDLTLLVVEKRITEGAEQCVWDDVCKIPVTLEELIKLGYAKHEVNPLTKMYYKLDSYVEYKDNTYVFVEVN